MGFFDRAWNSAADQYGRDRSEKYGRVARAWRGFQMILIIALVIGIGMVWAAGHQ